MKILLAICFGIFWASKSLASGGDISGGGHAMICLKSNSPLLADINAPVEKFYSLIKEQSEEIESLEVLDYRQALETLGQQGMIHFKELSFNDDIIFLKLAVVPRLLEHFNVGRKEFDQAKWQSVEFLPEVNDHEYQGNVPANCRIVQLAIRSYGEIQYIRYLYDLLSDEQKYFLRIHEVFYAIGKRAFLHTSSQNTRKLITWLSHMQNSTAIQTVDEIQKMQFGFHQESKYYIVEKLFPLLKKLEVSPANVTWKHFWKSPISQLRWGHISMEDFRFNLKDFIQKNFNPLSLGNDNGNSSTYSTSKYIDSNPSRHLFQNILGKNENYLIKNRKVSIWQEFQEWSYDYYSQSNPSHPQFFCKTGMTRAVLIANAPLIGFSDDEINMSKTVINDLVIRYSRYNSTPEGRTYVGRDEFYNSSDLKDLDMTLEQLICSQTPYMLNSGCRAQDKLLPEVVCFY